MASTPDRKRHRRRPRDSLEDEDEDRALDAMLVELGIPCGGSSCNREVPNRSASATVEIIELTTPSPPAKKKKQQQSEGPTSVVDLTTSPSSPTPSPSNGYKNTAQEVAEQEDEISFSYSPSASPPPFVYALPSEPENLNFAAMVATSEEEPEILSPEMTSARRQVFPDESKRAGAKQARRLSGQLKDLHSETIRGGGSARKKRKETTAASTVTVDTGARMTNSPAKSRTAASPCRSKPAGGRNSGAAAAATAVVQMEKSLDTSPAGDKIRDALKNHVYNGKLVSYTVSTALNCIRLGVIRWERKDSNGSHYSCAIYYEAPAFLEMIQKKTYMELVAAVRYLQSLVPKRKKSRQQEEEEPSKFFVIIEGMDRALIDLKKQQKKKKKNGIASISPPPMISFADLQEVAFQLFMDVGAHTKFTCDLEATANYVALLTRELVVASSRATALEELLESVPRYNSFRVTHSGGTVSASANAWLRMLQVIPGVSEDKAQCLLDHFPTFDCLMRAYRDPRLSRAQKEDLVADKLHDARIQRALSKKIYSVFCEEDPDTLI
ncbi:hypothetical protein JG688_00005419 [Phytophthora aleatoria]|uniref:ERCC4 domain-containing protein n=1 Tax=Phytophthora aleatoria TaxID=2496075 RepID=A0A8J5J250_9STRA|nr:hypothetical protein JG688_00005419 [Phytophthora aleatoria]